jgi:Uridylate kinase
MYRRVLLKLSGEALSGQEKNFDPAVLQKLAEEIKEAQALGVQIAVVVGGGNFIRGKTLTDIGIDRVQGDYMGMGGIYWWFYQWFSWLIDLWTDCSAQHSFVAGDCWKHCSSISCTDW